MKFQSVAVFVALSLFALESNAQTTAFTYQGQLSSNSIPANGLYDLRFQLFNVSSNAIGNPLTNSPTGVTNGLFSTTLDFGATVFDGSDRWLQIAVRNYGSASDYTPLSPLQRITSVPYAIRSINAAIAATATNAINLTSPLQGTNIIGIIPVTNLPVNVAFLNSNETFSGAVIFSGAVTANNAANHFAGTFVGDGGGLTSLPATNLTGTLPDARLSANVALQSNATVNFAGSVGASNFVGAGHGLTNVPGAFFWVIPTNGLMYPNVGYICTNDVTPVTMALPGTNSASVGDTYKMVGVGGAGWIITQTNGETIFSGNLSDSIGDSWTPRDSSRAWAGIASSADGTKLVACVKSGLIYTSTNSGATWTPQATSLKWSSVASSTDGTKLVGVVGDTAGDTGMIYTNDNSGSGTWTAKGSALSWVSIASSADGTKLIAAAYGASGATSGIYTSSNSGGTWNQSVNAFNCSAVASSADGTKWVIALFTGVTQGIWTTNASTGGGWILRTNLPNVVALASSADGNRLVAAAAATSGSGQVFVSADSGATWSTTSPSQKWTATASSADGSRLAAVGSDGSLYTSPDSGTTWLQRSVTNAPWSGITSSADGSKLAAVVNGGFIYTSSQGSTTTGTNGYVFGAQHSAIELIYTGNGNFLPLNHEGTIRAY